MEEIFIQNIKINDVRNIKDFEIPLSNDVKKHLIITGKNGSGKTSVLNGLKIFLENVVKIGYTTYNIGKEKINSKTSTEATKLEGVFEYGDLINMFGGLEIACNNEKKIKNEFNKGNFIIAFFGAKRNNTFNIPIGINKVDLKPMYGIEEFAGKEFIQYIVNLKADRSFAKDDKDNDTANKIDEWFTHFEQSLFTLFDTPNVALEFDRKLYNFNIVEKGKEPYNLNQLSDGFSAILNIVTELIMRMETHKVKSYDVQGIVLIDEVETHLHVDLQKKILPFLISFFPKIQFIVTTHSPFVLNSIENAVICDLEQKIVTTDLSGYSYDTLIETYFSSDKYSTVLKKHINEYEQFMQLENLSSEQKEKLFELKQYLNDIPKFMADELAVKLQQINLKNLKRK